MTTDTLKDKLEKYLLSDNNCLIKSIITIPKMIAFCTLHLPVFFFFVVVVNMKIVLLL